MPKKSKSTKTQEAKLKELQTAFWRKIILMVKKANDGKVLAGGTSAIVRNCVNKAVQFVSVEIESSSIQQAVWLAIAEATCKKTNLDLCTLCKIACAKAGKTIEEVRA